MSHSPENKSDLIANRQALLDLLFQEEELGEASAQNIPRRQSKEPPQLSFAQQRLWFLDQWEPGSSTYNLTSAVRLTGLLNFAALERSLNEIFWRHEALRTTFATVDGQPVQVVASPEVFALPVISLQHLPETEREAEAQRLVNDERSKPLDLTKGPLFRPTLLQLQEQEHILLLAMHHIVSDGWSMGILSRELTVLYEAFSAGHPSPLPELPIQYGDFAKWQREWLQGEVLERELSYWKRQLEGIPAVSNLPTDQPRPAVQSFRGQTQYLELTKKLTEGLKSLSRKEGVTLFMTLLAAFQTLLYRYTRQKDIVVGSPIANRNRSQIEGLIGFFVNTLVLRTDFSGNPSFRELLGRVRKTALDAYEHQDLPFEKLLEELQPERSLSYSPLFQVMFILQNAPNTGLEFENLRVSPVRVGTETAKCDLTLSIHETPLALSGTLQYNTDLFEAPAIIRMLEHFQILLEGIVANPEARVWELPILTEAEKRQVLVDWNETKKDYPKTECIQELFEAQVEKTPDAVAVVFEDHHLTYKELNERANQLAHYLCKLGVGTDVLVGICLERSLEMVVALLGVLKAGGAYLPLDSSYPAARLDYMLKNSGAAVLLTLPEVVQRLLPFEGRIVCVDQDRQKISGENGENPSVNVAASSLAYVIYTSGSTGQPKGVMIPHGAICNHVMWMHEAFPLNKKDRVAQKTSLSFDASVWELFAPLIDGAQLVLAPPEVSRDAKSLIHFLQKEQITILQVVPTLLQMLVEENMAQCTSLRRVFCGGEPLATDLCTRFRRQLATPLINLYGPTETAIDAMAYTCSEEDCPGWVPVGRPIANMQVYVLDQHSAPVPIGVVGELHIAGDGLARGYLNSCESTAEKFIPNLFSGDPGSRLYKTGDLVRYLPDGNIEFIGRLDNQVKIRGYRIELGEIESVLGRHPSVRHAVVLAWEDAAGEKKLVAYVVPHESSARTTSELRALLKQKLPQHMIPSAFVLLDALPLTPNGKVDRKALPAPHQSRLKVGGDYVAPVTPAQEMLAEIWAEVLQLEQVGMHENFFDLGGHSLLATQVVSRVCGVFQLDLPVRALFEAPTIVELAERVEHARRREPRLESAPLLPVSRNMDSPLSFAQQRLWFLDQLAPGSTVYNVPGAVRIRGQLDVPALEQSLDEIIRRHEALRTTFSMADGRPVQLISPLANPAFRLTDLTDQGESEREAEAQRLAREEARRPFDLTQGPLLRATLLRLWEDDHVLLLTMHHIVSDGWSMGVLYRELSVLYEAFSEGRPSPLADLAIQYADFAVWQREWLQGEVLQRQLSYWKKQLEGIPAVINLPAERAQPAVQSYKGARQSIQLSRELTQALKALSRSHNVTLYMTLLAAFQVLLHRYSGQNDIVVGSPIANRNRPELEGLIGFFVNTLILRTDLSANPSFRELLGRVRETVLGAYTYQDLPFEKLVEELQPERSLSHSPLFQVFFNMFHQGDSQLDLSGTTAEPFSFSDPESKFDLTLYVRDQNDQIRFNLVYRVDLFSPARMTSFLQQYGYLLEQIVAAPQKRIRSYSLVTWELRRLLPDASAPLAEPPQELVTTIFSSWVRRTPDQAAIAQGEQSWSYRELAERADTLARVLTASGLERGDVVAVCGRRSFGVVASMIAIFLSGGVVLLLDPNLPGQRQQLMLREARAKKILYVGDKRPEDTWLKEDLIPAVLFVDPAKGCTVNAEVGQNLEARSLPEVSSGAPAYIFFTSGTTGVPKGILGCHKSLSHFLEWQRETFAIGSNDRVAQLTSLSFDVVLREIFLPLTSGGTLCLPEAAESLDFDAIIAWLERERISVLHASPSLAQSWLASDTRGASLRGMRYVFFAGEPLMETLVRRWRAAFPSSELVNLYGPTETTLAKCFYRVSSEIPYGVQPVGRPLPETQALVFDENHQLCGINEPGEIVLRTPFRSLGYINAPAENRARFVKNPFRDDAQDLLYFTGDRGRYRPDGALEILGRVDDQVKIHGVRVEPAEVSAILARHPSVESCFVVARKTEQDETCLVAYVVASKQEKKTNTLRSYLVKQLPAAMIPAFFVFLDSLPLTSNGKVDRSALPAPDQSMPALEKTFVVPRTPVEKLMADIWSDLLKLERVGIRDNFFEIGGHSLIATQFVSRIRRELNLEIPLRAIFEMPTIESLAFHLVEQQAKATPIDEVNELLADLDSLSECVAGSKT